MYVWIHKCLKETILNLCGEEKWNEICEKSGVGNVKVSSRCEKKAYSDDEEYFSLFGAALELLPDMTEQGLYDLYGDYFISYIQNNGYEAYLRTFGDTLFDLLTNMNKLHAHLACSMDKMKIPIINCHKCSEQDCFMLHYSSPRGARLKGMLVGLVKSVARQYFSSTVELTELATQGDTAGSPATVWKVKQSFKSPRTSVAPRSITENGVESPKLKKMKSCSKFESLSLSADQFHLLAPYHVVFDTNFEILQMSGNMVRSSQPGGAPKQSASSAGKVTQRFRVSAAGLEGISGMNWDEFHTAALVVNANQQPFCFETTDEFTKSGKFFSFVGKIIFLKNSIGDPHAAVFLCSPNVETLEDMYDQSVSIQDLKYKDDCRKNMILNQANVKHLQTFSSEANEMLSEEVLTSTKAKGDLDAKRRLMMYISHEIRTPLSIVRFGFQLMRGLLDKLDVLHEEEGIVMSPRPTTSPRGPLARLRGLSPSVSASTSMPNLCPVNTDMRSAHQRNGVDATRTTPGKGGVDEEQQACDRQQARHAAILSVHRELDSVASDSAHSVEVAITILNDFLNYEKLQADVLDMFKDFTPCSLIKTVIDEFMVEASYFKVRLSFRTKISFQDESNVFIFADKQKISQVLRNFVSNALKFTPVGGSVTVSVSLKPLKIKGEGEDKDKAAFSVMTSNSGFEYEQCGTLHVGVLDTGAGIAKENHDQVFQELVQFHANELQGGGGTGLGLFISKAIVQKHDGIIGFESEGEGCGCKFFFELPAFRLAKSDNNKSKMSFKRLSAEFLNSNGSGAPASPLSGLTILICDDSNMVRKMLKKVLLGKGVKHCYEAANGLEAVQVVEEHLAALLTATTAATSTTAAATTAATTAPATTASIPAIPPLPALDLVLLDDRMPGLMGREAARRIRALGFSGPIAGVTGNMSSEEVSHFLAGGADIVLSKPLDVVKLEQFVLAQMEMESPSSSSSKLSTPSNSL